VQVTVQPPIITGDPTSDGGPTYYTETQVNALLRPLSPAPNQAALTPAAAVSAPLFTQTGYGSIYNEIQPGAGSGAFAASYYLPTAGMTNGAIAEMDIELPASANPTVNIYNGAVSGSPLLTLNSPLAVVQYWYARFRFDGTAWHCISRTLNL
jgi:hypothetical protein